MESEDEEFEKALDAFGKHYEAGLCENKYAAMEGERAHTRDLLITPNYQDWAPREDPAVWDLDAEDPLSLVKPEPIPDPGED